MGGGGGVRARRDDAVMGGDQQPEVGNAEVGAEGSRRLRPRQQHVDDPFGFPSLVAQAAVGDIAATYALVKPLFRSWYAQSVRIRFRSARRIRVAQGHGLRDRTFAHCSAYAAAIRWSRVGETRYAVAIDTPARRAIRVMGMSSPDSAKARRAAARI